MPIYVSGFGPKSMQLAGRIGDGYCGVDPDPETVSLFRSSGGEDKPAHARTKVCWAQDEVYIQQIGSEQEGFFDFYKKEVLPEFR